MRKHLVVVAMCAALLFTAMGAAFAAQPKGDGWPPAATLKEFGLEGMPLPAGAKEIWWRGASKDEGRLGIDHILIGFHGIDATDKAIKSWLEDKGWTLKNASGGKYYTKNAAAAFFLFNDGVGQIMAGVRKGVWPEASAWKNLGLNGIALPAGALVIESTIEKSALEVTVTGGKAAFNNLADQLASQMGKGKDLEGDGILTFWVEKTSTVAYLGMKEGEEEIGLAVEKR